MSCHYVGLEGFINQEENQPADRNEGEFTRLLFSRIDNQNKIIEQHTAAIDIMRTQIMGIIGDATFHSLGEILNAPIAHTVATTPENQSGFLLREFALSDGNEIGPMNIPAGHLSTTESLLRTEKAKMLVGDYPVDLFLRTERKRGQPEELRFDASPSNLLLQALENQTLEEIAHEYFRDINSKNPIINEDSFWELFACVKVRSDNPGVEEALVSVMCALVQVNRSSPDEIKHGDLPGKQMLFSALGILMREWSVSFQTNLHLCQALFLAASWCNCVCHPLLAWRMIHMASTNLQHILVA